jgi:hypothetical protein
MRVSRLVGVALAAPIVLGLGLVAVAAGRDPLLDRLARARRLDVSAEESGWEPLACPDPGASALASGLVPTAEPRGWRAAHRFDFILPDGTFVRAGTAEEPGRVLGVLDGFGGWRFYAMTGEIAARLESLVAQSVRASTRHVLGTVELDGERGDVILEERTSGWTVTIGLPGQARSELDAWLLARHGSTQAGRPIASGDIFSDFGRDASPGFGFVTQLKRRDLVAVVVSLRGEPRVFKVPALPS